MKIKVFIFILLFCAVSAYSDQKPSKVTILSENDLVNIVISDSDAVKRGMLEKLISEQSIDNSRSVFEPNLEFTYFVTYNYEQNNREQLIQRSTATEYKNRDYDYTANINGLVPTGTKYKIYYELNDPSNSLQTDDEFGREKRAKAGIELTQPLLKNFGVKANTANINIAKRNKDISADKYLKQRMLAAFNAIVSYSDIQFYQQKGVYESRMLELEKKRLEIVQKLVKAGRLSKSDIFDVETLIARKEARLKYTARQFRRASSAVRQMLLGTDAETLTLIEAKDKFGKVPDTIEALPADFDTFYQMRPDYKQAIKELDISNIRKRYAKNQRLPDVNLVLEYGMTELNESGNEATHLLGGGKYEYWNVGVKFSVPFGGKKGRSAYKAANLRYKMATSNIKTISALIRDEIVTAYAEMETSHKEIMRQKEIVEKLESLLALDIKMLESGKGNEYKVIARKMEILQSKIDLIEKISDFKKASTSLKLAKGTILNDFTEDK